MVFRRAPSTGEPGSPRVSRRAIGLFLTIAVVVGGIVAVRVLGSGEREIAALFLREGATLEEIQMVLEDLLTEPWGEARRYVEGLDSVAPGGYAEGRAIIDLYLEPISPSMRAAMLRRWMESPLVDTIVVGAAEVERGIN